MKTTKEDYKKFIEMYSHFEEKAEIVLELQHSPKGCVESVEFDSDTISFTTREDSHCGCCSDEYESYTIDIDDIFKDLDTLKEELRKDKEEKAEKARIKAEIRKNEEEAKKLAKKKETYLKLKQEFEN